MQIDSMVKYLVEGTPLPSGSGSEAASGYLPCPECGGVMHNYPRGTDGTGIRFRGSIECHQCGHQMSGIGHRRDSQ